MKNNQFSTVLTQLTCAALALPGLLQTADAARVEEDYTGEFQYGHYSESNKRMNVDIFEGAWSAPIGKSMTGSINLVRDTMAGASPVYNVRKNGKVAQVLSGASPTSECGKSVCDERNSGSGNLTYFFDNVSVGVGGGYSAENDYRSKFFNGSLSIDLNKKLTTLNFGNTLAFDKIQPSPTGYASPPFDSTSGFIGSKTSQQYLMGISQIIDRHSLVQSNMTFGYHNGYMSDPYKQVTFYGDVNYVDFAFVSEDQETIFNEKRPRKRFEWAWLTRYIRHFEGLNNAALHADYRFSTNDWGVNAQTFDLTWDQPIAFGWRVIPTFRYYSQDQADFYKALFYGDISSKVTDFANFTIRNSPVGRSFYSSDYRLAGFGAVSGGVQLINEITGIKPLGSLKFQTGIEYYSRQSALEIGGDGRDSFADYNYYLVTASIHLKF
jgi:hypothetical protein